MVESGDVIYVKAARNAPASRKKKISFIEHGYKGHIMAIAIGYIEPDGEPATKDEIVALMAVAGIFSGDDIIDALGDDAYHKIMAHLEKKYL